MMANYQGPTIMDSIHKCGLIGPAADIGRGEDIHLPVLVNANDALDVLLRQIPLRHCARGQNYRLSYGGEANYG
jgi:hypothetical protein